MKLLIIVLCLITVTAKGQRLMFQAQNQAGFATTDPDVLKFIAKVTNNGGALRTSEKRAVDRLVKDLKDSSFWTKYYAIYPMVGASRLSCGINLKDTTQFNITFVAGSPGSYTSMGVSRAGTTSTGLIPLTTMSATTGHIAFYSRSNPGALQQYDMGASDDAGVSVKPITLISRYSNNQAYAQYGNGAYTVTVANTDSRGFFMTSYESGVTRLFKNGTNIVSGTLAASLPNNAISLFAVNANGTELYTSNKQFAFASIGTGFTVAEAAKLYNIIQRFQAALGRQL